MSNLLAVFVFFFCLLLLSSSFVSFFCLLLLYSQLDLDLRNNQVAVTTDVCSTVHSDVRQTWSPTVWSKCTMVDLCEYLVVI